MLSKKMHTMIRMCDLKSSCFGRRPSTSGGRSAPSSLAAPVPMITPDNDCTSPTAIAHVFEPLNPARYDVLTYTRAEGSSVHSPAQRIPAAPLEWCVPADKQIVVSDPSYHHAVLVECIQHMTATFAGTQLAHALVTNPGEMLRRVLALYVPLAGALVKVHACVMRDGVMFVHLPPMLMAAPHASQPISVSAASILSDPGSDTDETSALLHRRSSADSGIFIAPHSNSKDPSLASHSDTFRQLIVALIELAEEHMACTQLVVSVARADVAAAKALQYLSFMVVSPNVIAHNAASVTLLACEL